MIIFSNFPVKLVQDCIRALGKAHTINMRSVLSPRTEVFMFPRLLLKQFQCWSDNCACVRACVSACVCMSDKVS